MTRPNLDDIRQPALTPRQVEAGRFASVPGRHGPLPPSPIAEQIRAYSDELPYIIDRIDRRVRRNKVHPAYVARTAKALRSVLATLMAVEAAGRES